MEEKRNRPHHSGQFVGSAVVTGASYGPQTTLLQLQTFAGEYIDYSIADVPDPTGASEFGGNNLRPISVKIVHGGDRCSVIVLTSNGSLRSNVTLGTALALHQSGVHTVVDGDLRMEVSCSTHKANQRGQTAGFRSDGLMEGGVRRVLPPKNLALHGGVFIQKSRLRNDID